VRVTVDDGVGLEVHAVGPDDAPGLLLVHGFGGAKEDFADHVGALAAHHRVVVFDHRGHGASDAPDDPAAYSLDRLAADTVAVANDRPATCGCSATRWAAWSPPAALATRC
jgi:3-oxoadipate enol-lactonase